MLGGVCDRAVFVHYRVMSFEDLAIEASVRLLCSAMYKTGSALRAKV
jgi:hypothetical protein